ncbi:MAG: polymer-forming cytoskeletal protein [Candidatus Omnitrophota bacterium]
MAFKSRKPRPTTEQSEPVEKNIEINAQMQGSLSFKDPVNLKINGNFNGTLDVRGTLTIGDTAFVEAHINGDNIVLAGKVRGDIVAKKMLVLMPSAVLTGNISTPRLNIVEGARFQGQCQMMDDAMSVDEVSQYLQIDSATIVGLADDGKIPGNKQGDSWTFDRSKIDTWASTGTA